MAASPVPATALMSLLLMLMVRAGLLSVAHLSDYPHAGADHSTVDGVA